MKIILTFAVLLLYQLVGNFIQYYFKLPVPGTVFGLILLFITLVIFGNKIGKTKDTFVDVSLDFLKFLPLLYVPAGVGIMQYFDIIKTQSIAIIGTLILSCIISIGVTAYVMAFSLKISGKQSGDADD